MTQYAYPTSDISTGGWTTTPLYGYIDEVTPVDADNIRSSKNPAADTFECKFGSTITDPNDHTGHVLRVRLKENKTNASVDLYLYQGTTLIASNTAFGLTTGYAEYVINVSEGEAANITDYTDLRVRVVGTCVANNYVYCSWARFETPDAGPAYELLAGVVDSISNVPDQNVKVTKGVVGVAVASTSNIPVVNIRRLRKVVGVSVDSVSSVADAPLRRIKPLVGSIISALSAVADTVLRVLREFVSVPAQGISTSAAVLVLTASLVGSAGGISSVPDENLKVTKSLVGVSVDSISDLTGDLDVSAGGEVQVLQGIIEGPDVYADSVFDGELDIWSSPTDLTQWSEYFEGGTSSINQESSEVYSGDYSARFDIDASGTWAMLLQQSTLDAGRWHTVRFWHNTPVGRYLEFEVRSQGLPTTQHFNFATNLWQDAQALQVCNGTGAWKQEEFTFYGHLFHGVSTRLRFWAGYGDTGVSFSAYLDKVKVIASPFNITGDLKPARGIKGLIEGPDFMASVTEDGDLEAWTSVIDLTYWNEFLQGGTSSLNQESGVVYKGQYSARFDVDASGNWVLIQNSIVGLAPYQVVTVRFWHNTPVGRDFEFRPRTSGAANLHFNFSTQLWELAANIQLCAGTGAWKQEEFTFYVNPAHTIFMLQFWAGWTDTGTSFSVYLDAIELIVHASNVYASLGATKSLQGQVDAVSDVADANLEVTKSFVGELVDSVSDVTGALSAIVSLKGSTDGFTEGVEWVAGAPASFLPTVEWVAGAPFANLLPQRPESNFAGDLTVTAGAVTLQGQVDAVSDVADANLEVTKSLIGVSVDAVSDVIGDLTISGAVVLQGQIDAVSDVVDANLEVVKSLSGQVDAVSDVADALLKRTRLLLGDSVRNILLNGFFEGWDSPTDVTDWVESLSGDATINREVSIVDQGNFSCRFDTGSGGEDPLLHQDITIVPGQRYTLKFRYRTTGTGQVRVIIRNMGSDVYLNTVGDWQAGWTSLTGNISNVGSFATFTIVFPAHDDYSTYRMQLLTVNSVSESHYWDSFIIHPFSVDTVSGVTGDLTVSGAVALQGQVDAVSDVVDASLKRARSLFGQVDAVSDVADANLEVVKSLIGVSVDSTSDVTGDLTISGAVVLQGQIDAVSDVVDANLEVVKSFVGVSVDSTSDVTGTLTISGSVDLVGQVDAISDVADANLKVVKSLSGQVDAVSNAPDVALTLYRGVAGVSVDAVSDMTGDLTVTVGIVVLQGQVDAISDVPTTDLTLSRGLTGVSVDAVSNVAGGLTTLGSVDLVGQVDAVLDVADANLEVVKSLSGQVDAVSEVLVTSLAVVRGLSGVSVDAVSDVTGSLQSARGIAGQIDAISDVPIALLEVTRRLTGVSVDAVSNVTGGLTTLGSVDLAGQIDAISSVTGVRPVGVVSLGGAVASASGTTALLRVTKVIAGVSVDAVSNVTGNLVVSEAQFLQGQVDAVSDVAGAVKPIRSLAGVVDAVSGSSGTVRPQRKLGGLCESVSSVNGLVRPQRGLQSSVAGASSFTGSVNVLFRLNGAVGSVSVVTGSLTDKGLYKIQGVVSAVSTVAGSLTVETFLVILFEVSVCEMIELDASSCEIIEIETSVAEEVNLDSRID